MLGLFDEGLDDVTKSVMALRLNETPRPRNMRLGKPAFPDRRLSRDDDNDLTLASFIGRMLWLIFELIDGESDWLTLPPQQWQGNAHFQTMAMVVKNMNVVNDAAERGIKDVTEYANFARDGTYRDEIIIVSNSHRCRIPEFLKNEMEENL